MFYRAWPGSSFLHVELYFLCGINGNKHTLTYTGSQGIHFFNTWWICLLRFSGIVVVVSARIVEWRHKYITWKGLGTRIGQIRHFVFIAGQIAIDRSSYLRAEVSLSRLSFLPRRERPLLAGNTLVFSRLSALGRLRGTEGNYGKY